MTYRPGALLDAQIAKMIFSCALRYDPTSENYQCGCEDSKNAHTLTGREIKPYSTKFEFADEVLNAVDWQEPPLEDDFSYNPRFRITALIKMEGDEKGWMARIDAGASLNDYYEKSCYMDKEFTRNFVIGETIPHAICLAALLARERYAGLSLNETKLTPSDYKNRI